ncbi:MAG: HAMP domain-containing sensor histidine kinase, partial [Oscillospiraceae bacterium]|nr:HAMP domain-containing sensor histidine kinase [Oscillospiraceae bacterium]
AAHVLYDSSTLGNRRGDYALMDEVLTALEGKKDVFRSEYRGEAFRSRTAVPVVYRGEILGAVYLYEYDTAQAELLQSIQSNLRYISIVVCVAALVLVVVLARALTRNTSLLLGAINRVREGEYTHRVEPRGKDEMARLADEFNRLTDRLQTTEEVRRRFVSDASHELKTPLASIRLLTDSVLQNPDVDPETVREFMGDIGEETDRLTRISERLLTLTRLDAELPIRRVPVAVDAVVARAGHMLQPLAEAAGVTITCAGEENCRVLCTEDDLYQVVFNLMENAVKYNLPGGRVDVAVLRREDKVLLTVSDTGVGIPEEDRAKIFDRFYRVDKARSRAAGGTGLGLSIVWETVKLHGGKVEVFPGEGGVGTLFRVEFPACGEEGGGEA